MFCSAFPLCLSTCLPQGWWASPCIWQRTSSFWSLPNFILSGCVIIVKREYATCSHVKDVWNDFLSAIWSEVVASCSQSNIEARQYTAHNQKALHYRKLSIRSSSSSFCSIKSIWILIKWIDSLWETSTSMEAFFLHGIPFTNGGYSLPKMNCRSQSRVPLHHGEKKK